MACSEDKGKLQSPTGWAPTESCIRSRNSAIQGIFLYSSMQKFSAFFYLVLNRKKNLNTSVEKIKFGMQYFSHSNEVIIFYVGSSFKEFLSKLRFPSSRFHFF